MNSSPSGYFTIPEQPLNEIKAALIVFINETDATITDLSGGVGLVNSVFGRSGTVTAQANDYTWAQINKTTSSLADIATRSASDLSSGTLPDARFPATLPAISGANLTGVLKPANIGSSVQAWDADLDAIAAISGTSGLLKKTAANTWSLDTSTYATQAYADALVVGLIDDRGNYDASGNVFPSSGGSGSAGAILKGDLWLISVAGTLGGTAVNVGDQVRALVDTPGQTSSNWAISEANIGYVPANAARILTAGAGLTGGGDLSADRTFTVGEGAGITVNADDVALTTPGTLTVSSSNNASGNHTHAITSSSNPGAAASLLASTAAGGLTLVDLLATSNLLVRDVSTGWLSPATTILTPQSGNAIRSTSYTSGLSGWGINAAGDAEFNNVVARGEFRASVFKYNEIQATAGTFGVFYSASALYSDTSLPGSYGVDFDFDAKQTDTGAPLFGVGDIVRFKSFIGGGAIGDSWATTTARVPHSGYDTYTATLNAGTPNVTYRAGTGISDWGPSGSGFITMSADGTIGASPNLTMGKHSGAPWSGFTTLLRLGNLNGSYGYATDVYGWGVGSYGVAGQPWLTIETTNGIRIGNNATVLGQWDTSGNILIGQTGAGKSNVYITAGAVKLRNNTTDIITLDTSEARFDNLIKMSGANAAIAIGTTPPTSASAGTGLWLDRTGMYGLLSNVVQATFDAATGAISAGAGNVAIGASGIRLSSANAEGSYLKWMNGANSIGQAIAFLSDSSPNKINTFYFHGVGLAGETGGYSEVNIAAYNAAGSGGAAPGLSLTYYGSGHANANKKTAVFRVEHGLAVGSISSLTIPNAMLDVRGDAVVTGLLKAGSTPTTLTNAAGLILDAALSTNVPLKNAANSFSANQIIGAGGAGFPLTVNSGSGGNALKVVGRSADHYGYIQFFKNDGSTLAGFIYGVTGMMALGSTGADILTLQTGVQVGSPTGGDKGAGTINAVAVYDDNVLLTDWLFDVHYDGHARKGDPFYHGQELFSLKTVREVTEKDRRLPWMPSRDTFESNRGLGSMTTLLWQGQEQQQLYIFELEDRIRYLEQQLGRNK